MTYSQKIAQFVTNLHFDDLPQSTIDYAKMLMLDTVGVALAASDQDVVKKAHIAIEHMPNNKGAIKLWGHDNLSASVQLAVFGNALASHALDYDDTHTQSILHGSAILTPLVLGLGEELKKDHKDMITAFIAGWEIAARVGIASGSSFHIRGFHSTAIAGFFGAVVAACKLYDLNENQIIHALGLCGSQAAGTTEFLTNGSSSKACHAGWAASGAIINANLAYAGLTGPETIFDGKNSIFHTHGLDEKTDLSLLLADLGTLWEVEKVSIKPYPCCHFAHAFIDCAMELRKEGITADDIAEITCRVDSVPIGFICDPLDEKHKPTSGYAAKFSLPFTMACALIDGELTLASFNKANLLREDVLALAQKIRYTQTEEGETLFPKYFSGHIIVHCHDGREIIKKQQINRGNPDNPLKAEEVHTKFRQNSQDSLSQAQMDRMVAFFKDLESQDSMYISSLLHK